ncbi:response regulator transcription factor [Hymenobacter sp. M29]|uniref:Response regulator transcription factor n=1 Tax=Hymenobacter mellowenesis TaxID=3063995 RepID=A0ABT9AFE7_9BACT|nr:response regulator transcription factor [Hymenobacter sp. M29]MDO7848576.1 response regulator transcription factor [Hymenobacter sp. M29]
MADSYSPLRILIVEDEPLFAAQLKQALTSLSYEVVGPALDPATALQLFQTSSPPPDIALLDIHLGPRGPDGIDLAKRLLAERPLPVIFLTSHADASSFARARQLGPAAYLVKPTDVAALQRAIELAIINFSIREADRLEITSPSIDNQTFIIPNTGILLPKTLFVKENGLLVKVGMDEITWVMAEGKHCQLTLSKGRVVQVRQSLQKLGQHLLAGQFVQIQRSYLINAKFIERIDTVRNIVQVDGHLLPIGLVYRDKLLERLQLL